MFTEIAPNIFSVDHQVAEGKNGILFGARGALAIDAGNYPEEGQAVAAFIRERGAAPNRLALTHGHGDHILGGGAFRDAEIYAHAATPAVIRRQIPAWAERSGESAAQVEARLIWPTVTYTDELWISLGDRHVHFFPTPGHSEDGVCAYVLEDRVLFAGDTVVTGIVPAIGDGDSRQLEASLRRLAAMEIDVLVAGHGPVFHGRERIREWLHWLAAYLVGVRAAVQRSLDAGQQPEAVADAVTFERHIGDRLPVEKHGMPRRHRNTVMKIVEEERGR
jgi:cyclase